MKIPGPDHPITITPNPRRVRITAGGRRRFLAYIDELESVVRDVHGRSAEAPMRDGWAAQS